MSSGAPSPAVVRALDLVDRHRYVEDVQVLGKPPPTDTTQVQVQIRVNLPQPWKAQGRTPKGVRQLEPVKLTFGPEYPLKPPKVQLRPDFDRSLAHINPGPAGAPPEPCLFEGSIDDLFHQQGLPGLVNHLVQWLHRAASESLIDPDQGWEPIRRDRLDDVVFADPDQLRSQVNDKGGFSILPASHIRIPLPEENDASFRVALHAVPEGVGQQGVLGLLESSSEEKGLPNYGTSVALLVWPPNSESEVDRQFRPDDVRTLQDLEQRAAQFGCKTGLRRGSARLRQFVSQNRKSLHDGPLPLTIVLCARRPYPLIGVGSPLELLPYIVEIDAAGHPLSDKSVRARPAALKHQLTRSLLQRMSGRADDQGPQRKWTLLGAGSVGSKLGMHLARAGAGPRQVVDRAWMSPHNAARHALIPHGDDLQIHWGRQKSRLLANAVSALAQPCTDRQTDILSWAAGAADLEGINTDWVCVNGTGSLAVREALARLPAESLATRVVDASLFGGGRLGMLSIEGPERNPNTGDLISWAYHQGQQSSNMGKVLFSSDGLSRQLVGEGCGSLTMPMSDARISMFTSAMGEALLQLHRDDLPSEGVLHVGLLEKDEMSIRWSHHSLGLSHVAIDSGAGIQVRVLAPAHEKIVAEVQRYPAVETGGVLLGRYSLASQTFYVVDVLPAPPDSRRSPNEFVLGKEGLSKALDIYVRKSGGALYGLGTWHSHLNSTGPSELDRQTAAILHKGRRMPSVMLIHTPSGYRALLATNAAH